MPTHKVSGTVQRDRAQIDIPRLAEFFNTEVKPVDGVGWYDHFEKVLTMLLARHQGCRSIEVTLLFGDGQSIIQASSND